MELNEHTHENGKCCSETVTITRCQLKLLLGWRRNCSKPVQLIDGGVGKCSMKTGHGGCCIPRPEDAELRF